MAPFKLVEKRRGARCLEIRVEGELDLAVADRLESALQRAAARHETILVGLQGCEFIDSTGIAILLRAHRQRASEGRRLAICGATGQALRVMEVTGMTENGLVFESAEQALEAAP